MNDRYSARRPGLDFYDRFGHKDVYDPHGELTDLAGDVTSLIYEAHLRQVFEERSLPTRASIGNALGDLASEVGLLSNSAFHAKKHLETYALSENYHVLP